MYDLVKVTKKCMLPSYARFIDLFMAFYYIIMKTVLGSYDSQKYQAILMKLKDEQRILELEEMIDSERIKRNALEQEARLLAKQIQLAKGKPVYVDK